MQIKKNSKSLALLVVGLAAGLAGGAAPVEAAVISGSYNVVNEFGASVFRYGYYEGTAGGALTPFAPNPALASNPNIGGYGDSVANPYLGVYRSNTGNTEELFTTARLPAGYLAFHPGDTAGGDKISVVRFVAPTTSTYNISASFFGLDTSGVSSGVFLYNNGTLYQSGTVNSTYTTGPGAGPSYSFSGVLNAGDTFDFAVSNGGNNYYNDSTGLQASIVATPEPSTWAMMVIGAGVLVIMVRRRKSASDAQPLALNAA